MRGFDGKKMYGTCWHKMDGYAISRIAQAQEAGQGNYIMAQRALAAGNIQQYNLYMGYAANWYREARIMFGIEERVFAPEPKSTRRRYYRQGR